jgi:hypothetical protein
MKWKVHQHLEVTAWLSAQAGTDIVNRIAAAIDLLADRGPALGRPLVDTVKGSRHANMKELRVGTVRILFAFDPRREAILLVAGDKRDDYTAWYLTAVPIADDRYDEWLQDSGKRRKDT